MDYEKEYNHAFEIAKGYWGGVTDFVRGILESMFPQLAESEDERIRKRLIDCLKFSLKGAEEQDAAGCSRQKDIEAYKWGIDCLEKQKEQKPLMSDGEIEDKKRDIVAAIRKYYQADYAAYLTSFLKGLSPEDNSDDEYGQEMLGIAYKLMYEYIPENLRTQEFWDSLKFMREYTGKVAIIHSYEHPAEWSEEDESKKERLISIVKRALHGNEYPILNDDGATELITWLKSLSLNLKKKNEDVAKLCSNEWSEEDKDYYDTIVRKLEVIGDDSGLSNNQIKFLREHCPSHRSEWDEEDEMKSVNDPKDLVRLLVQYNPDRKDEIEQKFGDLQKLL